MMESVNYPADRRWYVLAKKDYHRNVYLRGDRRGASGNPFIPQFGFLRGLFYGIFHSISAFCNAGFDLIGRTGAIQLFCGLL